MFKIYLIIFLSFSSFLFSERDKSSTPLMICDHSASMSEELLSRVLKYRESAFSKCLKCEGSNCEMKSWPADKKVDEAICKRIFCTPINVNKNYEVPADSPRGKSKFSYSYQISQEGRINSFKILTTKGAHNSADAEDYLKAFTKKTKYEPVVFEGQKYQITNLGFSMSVHLKHDWE